MSTEIDNYLAHYGVVGMKWGKRKGGSSGGSSGGKSKRSSKNQPMHESYSKNSQRYDASMYGAKYTKDVNNSLHAGKDLKSARKDASAKLRRKATVQTAVAVGIYGAYVAGPQLAYVGRSAKMKIDQATMAQQKKNGEKYAANLFADKNGLGSKPTVNLGYNSDTGRWE